MSVTIPKAGRVRLRWTRAIPVGAKSARVTRDRAGRWNVSVVSPQPEFHREATGAGVGLDFGVTHTAATSDAVFLDMPALLTAGEGQRLRRLQRRLARQQKGSNRRARTKTAIARVKARQTDRRKDRVEQTSTKLVADYDHISVEDLKVRNMLRSAKGTLDAPGVRVAQKRGLNRVISNAAWGMLSTRIEQKATADTNPVLVVAVNPAYTSQRCAVCGHTAGGNRDSQAVFACRSCGHTANADVNAAVNINAAGLAVTGRGGTPHRGPMNRQPPERRPHEPGNHLGNPTTSVVGGRQHHHHGLSLTQCPGDSSCDCWRRSRRIRGCVGGSSTRR